MKQGLRAFWYYTIGKFFYRTPPILTLFVTARCHLRCDHCFYWRNIDQKKERELSLEEIEKLSQELGHLELLLISGGEPFLRDDLAKIVEIFVKNNQLSSVSIPTNGLLPEKIENEVEKMLRISPKLLVITCFSLDGTEEIHDQIRGVKGTFKKVQESYQRLVRLQKKYKNLRIKHNATIFNLNYENLFKLIDQMPKLFPESWLLSLSLIRKKPRNLSLKLPHETKLKKLFAYKRKRFGGKRTWASRFLEKIIFAAQIKTLQEKKQILPCEGGRLIAVVLEDGAVAPCELLPPIGNLKKERFGKIWQSQQAKKLRKKIVNKQCYCTHECVLFPSLLAHPFAWLKLIFNRF